MGRIGRYRRFLKSDLWPELGRYETDQKKKIPSPEKQKPVPDEAQVFDLVAAEDLESGRMPLIEAMRSRRSRRKYSDESLTREELSFLLWSTQGISSPGRDRLRTVPSGGARHPFETYLVISRVDGLKRGLYRFLPLDHKLCFIRTDAEMAEKLARACHGQSFIKDSAVAFIWTAVPYRAEWRYGVIAHKMIAIDAGHLCQNLYLASESIGAGTCAIGAYDQAGMDAFLGVDGEEEFSVYVGSVGKQEA
ncbi:MAG: SagB/ThcOx family dehydrogenase [Deltaproteobacteria bacterium]|nr:SagB/ThcOx family dehydrogenase [Deltaproteobacteria bacterium]